MWIRRRRRLAAYGLGALALSVIFAAVQARLGSPKSAAAAVAFSQTAESASERWGFSESEFNFEEITLKSGDILGKLLMDRGLDYAQVQRIVDASKEKFNIKSMRSGKSLFFVKEKNGTSECHSMIYEPSPFEYIRFQLREPYEVALIKRDVQTRVAQASGVLETSFWQTLTDNGLSDDLADAMIDVLASSVDFYRQKKGDRFKVVYEQYIVEGKPVGSGKIIAAVYERDSKEYHAFLYEREGEKTKYYDYEGRPARKAFLKAPVKFSRISSRYSLNRLHPVLGFTRPHFGTDYAAPHGTPIVAVADGVVTEATRKGGNGIYVRIRHDKTYETQYLHMSAHAKGIRPGARVLQGQTIGYVGSTGLATGPHVCFRFWKNGPQVDHLRLNLPQPEPIKGEALAEYVKVRDSLQSVLNTVPYRYFKRPDDDWQPGVFDMQVTHP